ncbi:hypothetical protein bcgnr5369_27200 [Bacillus cereus]|uniref:homing endonuclease associated repeat-containing protein n=1 Tax=Bacillus cereus TaxID=1396 RepID=UPI003079ED31
MEMKALEKECIEQLQQCAKENGGYISTVIYKQSNRTPTFNVIINVFGTWSNAVKQAEIKSKEEFQQYCKEILIQFVTEFPSNPSEEMYDAFIEKYNHPEYPSSKQMIRALGKWRTILKAINLWDSALKAYPKELCSTHIRNCALINNGNITSQVYDNYRKKLLAEDPFSVIPSCEIIIDIYGSWTNAIKESDVSKLRAKLLLDFVQKEQEAKRGIQKGLDVQKEQEAKRALQKRLEISNPYARKN